MPLRKFRAAMSKRLDDTRDAAQQKIPAEQLLNQVPSRAIPPATPSTKGGVILSDDTPQPLGTADPGTAFSVSRSDHVHAHGDLVGGTLHAAATGSVAGFMSAADKAKEDLYPAISGLNLGDVLTALTSSTVGFAPAGAGSGTVTSVDITAPAAGLTFIGGPITTSGAITAALANDLAALEALSSTGIAVRSATDTWLQRSIVGTSNRVSVANGGGVAGDPTIDISASYVGQTSITTLGTIAAGTWSATKIGLPYGGTNADLSATGGSGQYLKQASSGAAVSVGTIPATDLTYSGLTTGHIFQATGATAAGFAALNLATAASITGLLPAGNGGTGVNNAGTLTNASNTTITGGGTLALGGFTLTSPATGTAALRGVANTFTATQTIAATLDSQQLTRVRTTASGNGYGIRFWDGTDDFAAFQALDLGGTSYMFFATNRQFDGSAWQQLNTRVGGDIQLTGDIFNYYTFPTSSSTPVLQMSMSSTGILNTRVGFSVGGTQVVTSKQAGWSAPTGTLTRGAFAVTGATTASTAQALAALITDLRTHGLI